MIHLTKLASLESSWWTLTKLWDQIMCYAPQGNITETKINLQPERFRWTLCTKHKHRCFLESLPESRHPRLKKKKISFNHRQNTDKELPVCFHKSNTIYLREYLLHNSNEFNYFVYLWAFMWRYISSHLHLDMTNESTVFCLRLIHFHLIRQWLINFIFWCGGHPVIESMLFQNLWT